MNKHGALNLVFKLAMSDFEHYSLPFAFGTCGQMTFRRIQINDFDLMTIWCCWETETLSLLAVVHVTSTRIQKLYKSTTTTPQLIKKFKGGIGNG